MKKIKVISVLIIFMIIWNVTFPCISHAANNDENQHSYMDELNVDLNTISNIKYSYEQLIILVGEAKKQELLASNSQISEQDVNKMISAYLQSISSKLKEEFANKITDESLKEGFLENADDWSKLFIDSRYGTVITQEWWFNVLNIGMDSIAGVLLYGVKILFIILPGVVLDLIGTSIASIGTENSNHVGTLSLDSIFFNKVTLLDINVFNLKRAEPSQYLSNENVIYKIRKNIATWYYAFRNFAIVFGLLALVYIGIKMAISELAESKAKYKKMLMDWFVSIILIFVLHYFIIMVVNLNNGIIKILDNSRETLAQAISDERDAQRQEINVSTIDLGTMISDLLIPDTTIQAQLLEEAFSISFVRGFGASILFILLIMITFVFFIQYIKRMAIISFLTIISPLITIMYSIDKSR